MCARRLNLNDADYASGRIGSEMFGANTIFTRDDLTSGGAYDDFVNAMGSRSFRFPGGTVTEELFDPDNRMSQRFWGTGSGAGRFGEEDIVTAREFISYANAHNASVDWVLPTEGFYSDERDADGHREPSEYAVYTLLDKVDGLIRGEYGQVNLDTITIGNEYWYRDSRESPEEYGKMANMLAKGLQQVFDAYRAELANPNSWTEPQIAIQTSLGNEREEIDDIVDQLDMEARDAIDVVETHYYPGDLELINNWSGHFDAMDDMNAYEGFGDLDYYVSEWNIRSNENADSGMEHASSLISQMEQMARHGVDQASIWGTAYANLHSRLAMVITDDESETGESSVLTPAGEVFRMMANSLVGTRVIDIDYPESLTASIGARNAEDQLVINAFGNDDRTVIFLSSRSADGIDLNINVEDLVGDYNHVWAQQLSATDNPDTRLDEGDATSSDALAHLSTHNSSDIVTADGNVHLSLDGYDIIRLEFTNDGTGVHMYGADQVINEREDYDDTLTGTSWNDTIEGNAGDDRLFGLRGNDVIYGGDGDDVIMDGDGNDTVVAGQGDDRIYSGGGNDHIFLDGGDDYLRIEDGTAHVYVDTASDATIAGFDASAGHTLSFMGAYDSVEDAMSHAVVQDDDLIFLHEDGGMTELLGAADQVRAIRSQLADFSRPVRTENIIERVLGTEDTDTTETGQQTDTSTDEEDEDSHGGLQIHGTRLSGYSSDDEDDTNQVEELLLEGSPAAIRSYMNSLTPEETQDLLDNINLDALMSTMPAENLPALLNALDDDEVSNFFENVEGDSLLQHFADIGAAANRMLEAMGGNVREEYLDRILDGDLQHPPLNMSDSSARMLARALRGEDINSQDRADIRDMLEAVEDQDDEANQFQNDGSDDSVASQAQCFVATAAYGDTYHPDVAYLRKVRDHILVHYMLGRLFIWFYWRVGPRLARWLRPYPTGRKVARVMLQVVIGTMRNCQLVARYGHEFRSSVYLSGRAPKAAPKAKS